MTPGAAPDLAGRTVLVVGASAGIGRALACGAVRAGATTVLAARRRPQLDAAVAEAGGGAVVVADVRDARACARLVDEAVAASGPLDLVVLAAGTGTLVPMRDADAAQWSEVLATNVVGLTQVVRAAVPVMAEGGVVAALSSETVGRPRVGLGPYGASKAALDQSFLSWQAEHPETRFCRVTVGATTPTEFGTAFDPDLLGEHLEHWVRHGQMQQRFMPAEAVAGVLLAALAALLNNPGVNVEHLTLRSPSRPVGSLDDVEF